MTRSEAIRILAPETTAGALAEIEFYAGFFGETTKVNAVSDACDIAVDDMRAMESTKWIPVTERLPENEKEVLICAERKLIFGSDEAIYTIVSMAFHTDGKMNTEESSYTWNLEAENAVYDEEADAFVIPEGWWEVVNYGEEFAGVYDFVTHWMPLPEPPKEAK